MPGRINSIVHIHNPSIEVHLVDGGINTGAAVILIAGGGHNTLNVGGESADFVPFFYNFGVNTIILRSRLRSDGYNPQTDEVYDTQQAIRMVRAYAKDWKIDPNKIGVMGFSAGAELVAAAAVLYDDWDKKNSEPGDPFAGTTSRPDFAGIVYPGPSPFARNRTPPPIPRNVPPAFIVCAGSDDAVHTLWAIEYFSAMLALRIPNIEMHLYGNGAHPGDARPDGTRMSGGLTYRNFTPYGTWQDRFIDWFAISVSCRSPAWRLRLPPILRRIWRSLRRRLGADAAVNDRSAYHARGVANSRGVHAGSGAWTPDDLWNWRTPRDPRISPDGRRVAYLDEWNDRASDSLCANLWLVSVGDRQSAPSDRWRMAGQLTALVARGRAPRVDFRPGRHTHTGSRFRPGDCDRGGAAGACVVARRAIDCLHGTRRRAADPPAWAPAAVRSWLVPQTRPRTAIFVVPARGRCGAADHRFGLRRGR